MSKNHSIHSPIFLFIDNIIRRVIDIFGSIFGLILLSPLFLIIAIKIKRSSAGPVIYKGKRAGRNGKTFDILKFRTMFETPESYKGPKVTGSDDNRITPFGAWLRKTKINELPQLVNVLKGEMSFVGPRPEDIHIVEGWPKEIRDEVLSVRPGITSAASVLYRDEEDLLQSTDLMDKYLWEILPSKLRLDQLYVRHRTFLADIDIIFWTLIVLMPRLKDFNIPRHLLVAGPFSRFTSRYLSWFILDSLIASLAIGFTGIIWRTTGPFDLGWSIAFLISILMAIMFSLINFLMGLNRISWSDAQVTDMFALMISSTVTTGLILYANINLFNFSLLPNWFIVATGLVSLAGFIIIRYRNHILFELSQKWTNTRGRSLHSLVERVIIIGSGNSAQFAANLLKTRSLTPAFSLLGFVDDDPNRIGLQINGTKIIGELKNIQEIIKKYDIGLVLFAKSGLTLYEQEEILSSMKIRKSNVLMVPDMVDLLQNYSSNGTNGSSVQHLIENTTLDLLTGSFTWDYFHRLSEREVHRTIRYGHPLSIIFIKVHFPKQSRIKIHPLVRGKVLQNVVHIFLSNIRKIDMIGRFTDEEFIVLLPETQNQAANAIAQRMKGKILQNPIHTDHGVIPMDLTVLVSSVNDQIDSIEGLIEDVQTKLKARPRKIQFTEEK